MEGHVDVQERMAIQRAARLAAVPNLAPREDDGPWGDDMRSVLARIATSRFTLDQVYHFVPELKAKHPMCRVDIKAQVRHQLQVLRDCGELRFLGTGIYQKLEKQYAGKAA